MHQRRWLLVVLLFVGCSPPISLTDAPQVSKGGSNGIICFTIPCCGDGACDMFNGENCATCTDDCACPGHDRCLSDPDANHGVCFPPEPQPRIVTGADAGGGPHVRSYDAMMTPDRSLFAFDGGFRGGVRVAAASDVDRDGIPEIVAAMGLSPVASAQTKVAVFPSDGPALTPFTAYASPSGAFVATGDLDGDGVAEIVTGQDADPAGTPLIKVFRRDGTVVHPGFTAFEASFRGGVRVAVADVDGDGRGEIIAGSGPGRAPSFRVFRADGTPLSLELPAFDPTLLGGVYVGAGKVEPGGRDAILVSKGDPYLVAKPVVTAATGLRYLGYYWGDSDAYGHFMHEYAGYTNVTSIQKDLAADPSSILEDAKKARRLGLAIRIELSGIFFAQNGPGQPEGFHLRGDWHEQWVRQLPALRETVKVSDVFAFYIMDEPYGNNLSRADVEIAAAAVKAEFPDVRTMITESESDFNRDQAPAGIDLYSIDCYMHRDRKTDPARWTYCEGKIRQALAWSSPRPFLISADAYGPPTPSVQQNWFETATQLANENSRVIGMLWFLYTDGAGHDGTQGNADVIAAHRAFALGRMCTNHWQTLPVCGANGVSYQNPDLARCAGTTIAAYGACSSQIRSFRGDGTLAPTAFSPFPTLWTSIRVAGVDLDNDGRSEIIAGTGPGIDATVATFLASGLPFAPPLHPYPGFTGGVFVAGGK